MPIIRAPGAARRSPAVKTDAAAARQERQQIKALQTDLQTIIDGIDGTTTLAQLRGHVRDMARAVRRLVRLVD
jgi:hypothetical protein